MHSKAVENLKTAREQKYYMKIEYEYKFPELHLWKHQDVANINIKITFTVYCLESYIFLQLNAHS